jgi:hypothetical protein
VPLVQRVEETVREQDDVAFALAQRREADREDGEPEVEVLAQEAVTDRLGRRAVGRRDDAHVGGDRLAAADPLDALRLERAQQLDLERDRHLRDLVEEERAAVRPLEDALLGLRGAGEAAAFVAEELALDQRLGDRTAVDRDERRGTPRAALVDRLRDDLLAGAALAFDQDRRLGRRDPFDLLADRRDRARIADQRRRAVARRSARALAHEAQRPVGRRTVREGGVGVRRGRGVAWRHAFTDGCSNGNGSVEKPSRLRVRLDRRTFR